MIIKVKLLKGIERREIRLDDGGGLRHITMLKSDSIEDVKKKIKESYFCGESREASFGSFESYVANFLDFKKDHLALDRFESLEKYLRDYGLKPNQGSSFYLHLLDRPRQIPPKAFNSAETSANTSLRHAAITETPRDFISKSLFPLQSASH